jgi:hypothetical protein
VVTTPARPVPDAFRPRRSHCSRSRPYDRRVGSGIELGPPVFAVKNTAARWATTINYDLLIYEDKLVVARGLALRGSLDEARVSRAVLGRKRSPLEGNEERVRGTSERQLEELLAVKGNRLIKASDIASANLKRRFGICTLTLNLQAGERLKYRWMNSASLATEYEQAKVAFRRLLGPRLSV